jgi:PleD family two-component response regulator
VLKPKKRKISAKGRAAISAAMKARWSKGTRPNVKKTSPSRKDFGMATPAIPATSKCRVVVVDDEIAIANTLKAILNNSGFDAHAMFSGQ